MKIETFKYISKFKLPKRIQILTETLTEFMKIENNPITGRLVLKTIDGYVFPTLSEIIRFEGGHNFVQVFLSGIDKPEKIPDTLLNIENIFSFPEFFRCHKSHIVNLNHVLKYEKKCRKLITTNGIVILAENRIAEFESKTINEKYLF